MFFYKWNMQILMAVCSFLCCYMNEDSFLFYCIYMNFKTWNSFDLFNNFLS